MNHVMDQTERHTRRTNFKNVPTQNKMSFEDIAIL